MNQVGPEIPGLSVKAGYQIADAPEDELAPFGALLGCYASESAAELYLRDTETDQIMKVTVVEVEVFEHDRVQGGILFEATLDNGRHASGFVFTQHRENGSLGHVNIAL